MTPRLQQLVLRRLGFEHSPTVDLPGLQAVYRAWCAHIPFDNLRKMIALRMASDSPLPGGHAVPFFENWLAGGTGGTCWPTSNALFALLHSLGFAARRITGAMRDLGVTNHGSVSVSVAGQEWLVDSSVQCNVPLPLGDELFIHDDPVFPAQLELDDSSPVLWFHTPPNSTYLPCRLSLETVPHEFYLSRYEDSRAQSPFNDRLYARRNHPRELVLLIGHTRFSKTAAGVTCRDLSPQALRDALHDDIGIAQEVIAEWVCSGSLDDSLRPPAGPDRPPLTRQPPSRRRT